jgi:RNA polymerase sigma-70 factor (ECF subfamily)
LTDSPTPSDPAAAEDAAVIRRVLAGDRDAFGLLVARYGRRVHDLARRMLKDAHEAEDVVQQTFWNVFRALPRYDPTHPFRHWCLRIATNLCRNRLVSRRTHPRAAGDDPDSPHADPAARPEFGAPEPDALAEGARVRAAVDDLPDAYRLAVVLRYVHGLPLEDIAEVTGEPVATVKTHLHRARALLRRVLGPPGETESDAAGTTGRNLGP